MELLIKFLPENIPSKKNQKQIVYNRKTKKPFIISQKKYTIWNKQNVLWIKQQYKGTPISKCNNIELGIHFYTKHRKDLTNVAESIMDCLVEAGILEDDNWMVTGDITLRIHNDNISYAKINY